jgi:hypothetical protein
MMLDLNTMPDWLLVQVDNCINGANIESSDSLRRRLIIAPLFYRKFYSAYERIALMVRYKTLGSKAARQSLLTDFKKSTDIALGYDRVITADSDFFSTPLTDVSKPVVNLFPEALTDAQYWALLMIGFSGNAELTHRALTHRSAPHEPSLLTRLVQTKSDDGAHHALLADYGASQLLLLEYGFNQSN